MSMHRIPGFPIWSPTHRAQPAPGVFLSILVICFAMPMIHAGAQSVDRLILISLDGVRTQEMFLGLDTELLMKSNAGKKPEDLKLYQDFHGSTPEESRARLMPFLWKEWIPNHGVILGNRHKHPEHAMKLQNRRRFSYPGYAEILTGAPHDKEIASNDKFQNPFPTVLDFLQSTWNLDRDQVAAFASWDVIPYIATSQAGSFFINGGYQNYPFQSSRLDLLNLAQFNQLTPWDSVRHDFTTFSFVLDYLERKSPKVLYMSLGETDDWAHMDRYDMVLQSLHMTDGYLRQLWNFLQSHPMYKNRTGIVLCTDHGRGDNIYNWMSHNDKLPGAEFVWMAVFTPDLGHHGEWNPSEPVTQSHIASTWCDLANLNFQSFSPTSAPAIPGLLNHP